MESLLTVFFSSFFHTTTSCLFFFMLRFAFLGSIKNTILHLITSHMDYDNSPSTGLPDTFPLHLFLLTRYMFQRFSQPYFFIMYSHRLLLLLAKFAHQLNKTFLFSPQSLYMLSCTFGKLPFFTSCSSYSKLTSCIVQDWITPPHL